MEEQQQPEITVAEYGSWTSPLTPEEFGKGNCGRLGEVKVYKDSVFWIESNIQTGKKELYEAENGDKGKIRRWASGMSVQNAVHEYGGGSYDIWPSTGTVAFTTVDGVYLQEKSWKEPVKLIDTTGGRIRYADLHCTDGLKLGRRDQEEYPPIILCIEEEHGVEGRSEPVNRLAMINTATKEVIRRSTGADFFMSFRLSPCKKFVSWMEWNHINMPWDETSIYVQMTDHFLRDTMPKSGAEVKDIYTEIKYGVVVVWHGKTQMINYHGPCWHQDADGTIRFIYTSDEYRHWNVFSLEGWDDPEILSLAPPPPGYPRHQASGWAGPQDLIFAKYDMPPPENILPIDEDIGFPPWDFANPQFALGHTHWVFNAQGVLYKLQAKELMGYQERKQMPIDTKAKQFEEAKPHWNSYSHLAITNKGVLYCVAQGERRAPSILRVDMTMTPPLMSVVRHSRDPASLEAFDISIGQKTKFKSEDYTIYGMYYAPKNRLFKAPPGTLPPMVVMGHSGPTLPTSKSLDLKKQFLTSRGFAVFDVAYRGTSGCGSLMRWALYQKWGLADRDDLIEGAALVCEHGLCDPARVAVWGSSATGFTALACAIKAPEVFRAAVSIYGVADLEGLLKDTHKFEKGYNVRLVGLEQEDFVKRSPINHIDKMKTPTVFLHGTEDTVVPVQQSISMHKALKEKGVTTGLMLFEGEGHGFRGAQAVKESTEAAYYFLCKIFGIKPSVESKLKIDNLKK